jgi:5'(3')-deoxyribonucleotidase
MNKALEYLIEHYQVYIVAPAPTNEHEFVTSVQNWVEKYVSTPAHDRIIFTNRKGLLYGDFFIDSNPSKSFMGTGIEYGSDEFKTWEEVLVYFKRLGGV